MKDVSFGFPATRADPNQPRGHFAFGPGPLEPMPIGDFEATEPMISPAGGISSSIGDFGRYAILHLRGLHNGSSVMSSKAFRLLHTPDPTSQRIRKGTARYTWGWEITQWPAAGIETHWHNGSSGAFYAEIRLFPKENLAIAVMSNAGGPIAFSGDQIVKALYDRYGAKRERK